MQGDSYKDQWMTLRRLLATKINPVKLWFEANGPLLAHLEHYLEGRDLKKDSLLALINQLFELETQI